MSEAIGSNTSITEKKKGREREGRKERRKKGKGNHTLTTLQLYRQHGRESPRYKGCLTLKVLGTPSAPQP